MKTYAYGFPRLGKQREYKKLIEGYWANKVTEKEMLDGLNELNRSRETTYSTYVDNFPRGEMTLYDNVFDAAIVAGIYDVKNTDEYYALCRGKGALEMTKWFNTNYHYLVPDFLNKHPSFRPQGVFWEKYHNKSNAYMVGPLTLLKLSKNIPGNEFRHLLSQLCGTYREFIVKEGFSSVHMDDPGFVLELSDEEWKAVEESYSIFEGTPAEINIFTYYDSVERLDILFSLPVSGIGLDFVHDRGENLSALKDISSDKTLFAGVIDGRNVWRNNLQETSNLIINLQEKFNVVVTNAAPLFHLPVNMEGVNIPRELQSRIAFAEEKLKELRLLKELIAGNSQEALEWNSSTKSGFGAIAEVQNRIKNLKDEDFVKRVPYKERVTIQKEKFGFPMFPTTTIGSFPQTEEVRKIRLLHRNGKLDSESYKTFIRGEIAKAIKIQEEIGLDVLVHGEFERTDMVEFFAEKMDGIATTNNGWIISYGTRCYRPPIIYGDVQRPKDMTVEEISYAQSLTKKPVKGMLTGPVTIIAWSYCREDVPQSEVAYQIALALKDEISSYEKAGISIVQIDEPAFREKAPIKRKDWTNYFNWAVKAFKLCHSSTKPETQVHTHMCYSEFGEIIEYIAQMDFDVISIEASRSRGDIIESFERVKFDKQIGLGVWDIHSPYVPSTEEMKEIVNRALKVIPPENFWINPDCGLKTRRWEEAIPAMRNIVALAHQLRNKKQ